jgi:hypothetical protein
MRSVRNSPPHISSKLMSFFCAVREEKVVIKKNSTASESSLFKL